MNLFQYITPNDPDVMGATDSESIQNALKKAKETGCRKVVIPRGNERTGEYEWIIDKTVFLPDDINLVLDNCHLRMADDVCCNMIANENRGTEKGKTADGTQHNIIIEGRGRAVLDGGKYNGLSELNYNRETGPFPRDNCTLMFINVDNFRIRGLHFRHQRYWAMNFMFCSNGKISDIDFLADHTVVDENGSIQNVLSRKYPHSDICVKNADGIDLRAGCHDIIVENITGFTEDDTVALTALANKSTAKFAVEGMSPDIRNIIIRNINSATLYANVRLLNQGGTKIYNILIDGIMDASADFPGLERGSSAVRIGDHHMYGSRHATSDEIYNVTVRNVFSRAIAPLNIVCEMKNFNFDNIMSFDK